jgi:predicted phage baseplate assembly protein
MREVAGGAWRRWREVDELTLQPAGARVFTLDGRVLRFGDGRAGRQPVLADVTNPLRVDYWAGGGEAGNIPAGSVFEHPDFEVRNVVAAVGGSSDEPLADARARAMKVLNRIERAVTKEDIESLAETAPGVAVGRAIAMVGVDEWLPLAAPGLTTVYVVPSAPRNEPPSALIESVQVPDPTPDPGTLAAVRARLEQARLLGSEIHVRPPRWRDVRISVRLSSAAALGPEVAGAVRTALEQHLDPLAGGDVGRGWPLGVPIDPSAWLRRIQSRLPDTTRVEEVAVQAGCLPPESCRPVSIGRCHLPRLAGVTVSGVRMPETGGGLK